MLITPERFNTITAEFPDKKVMVVGDIYLDETNFGRISEMSLEAPIPVFEKTRQYHNPGAAGNVAANLASMGGQVWLVGVVGEDVNAGILRKELDARGIDYSSIVVDADNPTNTYGKFRAGGDTYPEQEILRSDTPRQSEIPSDIESKIIESIKALAPKVDAIVIIDQVSYLITPKIVSTITDCAREHDLLTIADSRERIGMIKDVDVVVPNESELGVGMNLPVETDEELQAAANAVLKQSRVAFITRGARGITVFAEGTSTNAPTFATEVVDVTGAGDTVTASATLSVMSGGALQEAAEIANAAAANAVRQLGAVSVNLEEIENTLFAAANAQSVVSGDTLKTLIADYQSTGKSVVWTNGCFDILHAGHVTYLMEAARQGDILVVGLNSDASVSSVKGPDRPIVPESERALIIGALRCVDHVIIFDDDNTVALIDRFRPDIYAKGGDYTLDTINQDERKLMESYGGKIALIPGVDGQSTTSIIQKLTS
ncbi:MAG: PfkB family carbohydrate kinase [Candidatus Hydrogenedentota bacterium]